VKNLVIFDLDGTLADNSHRKHLVEGKKKDFDAFDAACVGDSPHKAVYETLWAFAERGFDIWIFSGRSDEYRTETIEWLAMNCVLGPVSEIKMRRAGDYTKDDQMKQQWYKAMSQHDKDRLLCVFDDRDRVVKMWRSLGVTCFQVAEGDF